MGGAYRQICCPVAMSEAAIREIIGESLQNQQSRQTYHKVPVRQDAALTLKVSETVNTFYTEACEEHSYGTSMPHRSY